MEQANKTYIIKRNESSASDDTNISSTSSSTEDESTKSSIHMPPAPDGGYGWVIVVSAFTASVISDGISFSLGILYTRLLEVFQENKSVTSWVPSLFYGMSLIGGPLAGALVSKYGCRKMAICGGLLSSLGIILSSFANSVLMLCFTFGIIAGFGISIEFVTSLVVVAFYFEKKRALAIGLAVCGSGIGTFVFAPLLKYLMDEYDWRGALLIVGGVTMNLVVCGALFRPLEFTPEERYLNNLETFEKMSSSISKASLRDNSGNRSRHVSNSGEIDTEEGHDEEIGLEHLCHSQIQLPTFVTTQIGEIPEKLLIESRRNGSNLQQLVQKYHIGLSGFHDQTKTPEKEENGVAKVSTETVFDNNIGESSDGIGHANDDIKTKRLKRRTKKISQCSKNEQAMPLLKKDLFYRGNLMKVVNFKMTSTSCPELYNHSFFEEDDDSSDDEDNDCVPKLLHLSKRMKKFLKTMFDLSIMKNLVFVLFLVSNFFLYFWIDIPYVFIVDRAIEIGISDFWSSFFVSIIGILNTVGQIIYGFLGDTGLNLAVLYGISTSLCGVSLILVPLFVEFVPIAILSGGFGFFISANYVLCSVILVEYLGMDKLTNAYGLTMLMQGVANMIGPPVAGSLYDASGNYDNTFYVGGVSVIFSGLLMVFVPLLKCIMRKRRRYALKMRAKKDLVNVTVEMNRLVSPEN
ncbi:hypothetical protein KUTeg_003975 [Tegillarca granosa]|uniref:Major facilitator superfamily (MFS) profile domain-containing protein n=1 Tax=Tegillarca granosa TaxID=220873 RepID=A0ABQ9FNL7_TEGGR|nr:hypothetical protein KUTeg_003975 [Tegillarca granosa]